MKKIDIFISENDTLDNALVIISDKILGISGVKKNDIQNKINKIFSKVYNNRVGYCVLYNKTDGYYLKLYVLPKIIDKPNESKDSQKRVIRNLLKYMMHHYRLRSKYKEYNEKILIKSNQDVSFDTYSSIKMAQSVEELMLFKYKVILQQIRKFFIKHKAFKRGRIEYVSQNLKNKVNLKKNIKEINKTLIHQEKSYDIIYSELATVAFSILKLFQKKINILDEQDKKEINSLTKLIQNLLIKKYRVRSKASMKKQQLLSKKLYKLFRKKIEHKKLYSNLLALFGIENFFDEESNKDILLDIKADALFIQPDVMYEWYVYDWIIRKYCKAKKMFNIEFDTEIGKEQIHIKSIQNKKPYKIVKLLNKNQVLEVSNRSSEPDIVIITENKSIVIDAKWKILDNLKNNNNESTNPKGLNMSDVLKLQRDKKAYEAVDAFLVFAKLPNGVDGTNYGVKYLDEIDFKFTLVDIHIDLLTKV